MDAQIFLQEQPKALAPTKASKTNERENPKQKEVRVWRGIYRDLSTLAPHLTIQIKNQNFSTVGCI